MEIQTYVIQAFRDKFGKDPALVVRAPGRINLIGEHTDYNEGFVLPAAIDRAVWFAISPRSDHQLVFHALDLEEEYRGTLHEIARSSLGWPNYLLGCFTVLQAGGYPLSGVNLVFGGDIPLGAGLSSSAAIECGILFALNELNQLGLSRPELARLAQKAENNFVGMNCGIMDMFASLMGKAGSAIKLDCRTLEYEYIPILADNTSILLCDTGVKHQLVDSEYNNRRQECEEGVRHLQTVYPEIKSLRDISPEMLNSEKKQLRELVFQRCKYVIEENERVLSACKILKETGLTGLGTLLYASHAGLRNDYQVSCPELDFLIDQSPADNTFFGARMVGGGFGGCTLNVLKKDSVSDFKAFISKAYLKKWGRELRMWEVKITDGVEIVSSFA
jgi:galactokinase